MDRAAGVRSRRHAEPGIDAHSGAAPAGREFRPPWSGRSCRQGGDPPTGTGRQAEHTEPGRLGQEADRVGTDPGPGERLGDLIADAEPDLLTVYAEARPDQLDEDRTAGTEQLPRPTQQPD